MFFPFNKKKKNASLENSFSYLVRTMYLSELNTLVLASLIDKKDIDKDYIIEMKKEAKKKVNDHLGVDLIIIDE